MLIRSFPLTILILGVLAWRDAFLLRSSVRPRPSLRFLVYLIVGALGLVVPSALSHPLLVVKWRFWLVLAFGYGLRWLLVYGFTRKPSRNGFVWITAVWPSPLGMTALLSLRSATGHVFLSHTIYPAFTMVLFLGLPRQGDYWENSDDATQFSQSLDLSVVVGFLFYGTVLEQAMADSLPFLGLYLALIVLGGAFAARVIRWRI